MNYQLKNVEVSFFKHICKIQDFQSSTGLPQGKMFSLIVFEVLYKAAVLNQASGFFNITFDHFILLGDF